MGMYVGEELSKRVYTVLSVILYMTWLTISALCGSYHDVLALNLVLLRSVGTLHA